MDNKNLMGLNLSIDNNLLAEAAHEAIIAGIAEEMKMKDEIVRQFVAAILSERVLPEDGGKPHGWSGEKTCSRMEYIVRKAICEIAKEELNNMLDEIKPQMQEAVRREFAKKKTQEGLVEMFLDAVKGSITNKYTTSINLQFTKEENY